MTRSLSPSLNKRDLTKRLTAALRDFRKIADDNTGPDQDVRLVVDVGDETWWLATGDVQYDTVHGDLCIAGVIHVSMDAQDVSLLAGELIDQVDGEWDDFESNAEPTTEECNIALAELVAEATPEELLSTPGVYEALSEAWNNDIIKRAKADK